MRKLLCLLIVSFLFAESPTPSPFKESSQPPLPQTEESDDMESLEGTNNQMMFLDAIQESFFKSERKKTDNSVFINYHNGETYKIRLRYAMTTSFIFANDEVSHIILGDDVGFNAKLLGEKKHQISNIVLIKPLQIGIDSNLTIVGKSGKIYTFYIFSTHFTNRKNPAISVFISSNDYNNTPQNKIRQKNTKQTKASSNHKKRRLSDFRGVDYQARVVDDGRFLKIGDEVNHLYIQKSKIIRGYKQKPRAFSSEAKKMMALEIFNDDDFTYFKFNRASAKSKFPTVYKVVDGYDNPVNSKVVGDYLIAEDISDRWTLRMGDEYVCVSKVEQ